MVATLVVLIRQTDMLWVHWAFRIGKYFAFIERDLYSMYREELRCQRARASNAAPRTRCTMVVRVTHLGYKKTACVFVCPIEWGVEGVGGWFVR